MKRIAFLLISVLLLAGCNSSGHRFELLDSEKTGLSFINEIKESDSVNILIHNYIYNGAGVGVGDFNNDGLEDLFFAGNLVENRLFVNQGRLKFSDVSPQAGIEAKGQWCSGVNVFDINMDGLLDIYVTATYHKESEKRENLLFINQGIKDGIPFFENQADQYGLADDNYTTHSLSFDYDKDGDLDLYLINNKLDIAKTSILNTKYRRGNTPSNDRLYRNDGDSFTDVTLEANIKDFGFGLGIALLDANEDGWPDLYISNDFVTNDLLYINQQDGTFENEIDQYTNHQSFSSMGNDIADIDNDGLLDIFTLDMLPREDARMKMMFGGVNPHYYDIMLSKKYELEYARNVLQLNRGNGKYSDISLLTDLHNTDWSWSILMQDFTNDGLKDMFISNGFPRDITDLDFSDYHSGINVMFSVTDELLSTIPRVKIPNLFIENEGALRFEDVSKAWAESKPSYSNGAAYADLDNDGDLDLITSNINDPVFIYENNDASNNNFLQIKIGNTPHSISTIGTKVTVHSGDTSQLMVYQPNRGYCSTSQNILHFGLGKSKVDSIVVEWMDQKFQSIPNPDINQVITIEYEEPESRSPVQSKKYLFALQDSFPLNALKHQEKRFYDFDFQPLVQSLDSEKGPALAVGDLDMNGTDDIVFGGNIHYPTRIAYQDANGNFSFKDLVKTHSDAAGILIFDIDKDGMNDIFITQGSSEITDHVKFRNRVFINKGNGNFEEDQNITSASNDFGHSCIASMDFDKDGDMDLFLGGHSIPGKFPLASNPQLLINQNGKLNNEFDTYFDLEKNLNLTNSAIWSDVNGDSWPDLITVGKWNSIIVHYNEEGRRFRSVKIPESTGLWTSITGSDLDADGDIDYIVGNQGRNNKYNVDEAHPMRLHVKDFDQNQSLDLILSHFVDGKFKPYHLRNDATKQLKSLSKIFKDYKSYSTASTQDILNTLDTNDMQTYIVEHLDNSVLMNLGNGDFELFPLPRETQFSCIHGIISKDLNDDNFPDVLSVGNDFGTEVFTGRTDAGFGNILMNDEGNLYYSRPTETNFYAGGNTRGLVSFKYEKTNSEYLLIARNNDQPLIFSIERDQQVVKLPSDCFKIIEEFKDGTLNEIEFYHGGAFLSQTSKHYFFNENKIQSITSVNARGVKTLLFTNDEI